MSGVVIWAAHVLPLQCMPHLPASIPCGRPFLPSGAGSPSLPTAAPLPCTQTVTLRRALPLDIKGSMRVGESLHQARMACLEVRPAVGLPALFAALLHVHRVGHPHSALADRRAHPRSRSPAQLCTALVDNWFTLEDVGIEDLTIEFKWAKYSEHHQASAGWLAGGQVRAGEGKRAQQLGHRVQSLPSAASTASVRAQARSGQRCYAQHLVISHPDHNQLVRRRRATPALSWSACRTAGCATCGWSTWTTASWCPTPTG